MIFVLWQSRIELSWGELYLKVISQLTNYRYISDFKLILYQVKDELLYCVVEESLRIDTQVSFQHHYLFAQVRLIINETVFIQYPESV